jgi:hypothetical protein
MAHDWQEADVVEHVSKMSISILLLLLQLVIESRASSFSAPDSDDEAAVGSGVDR